MAAAVGDSRLREHARNATFPREQTRKLNLCAIPN